MGLKTTNYTVESLGITVPEAYAKINNVSIKEFKELVKAYNEAGIAMAQFYIQQSREDMSLRPFKIENFRVEINKDLPIFSQLYVASKETLFEGWEDDIVEE